MFRRFFFNSGVGKGGKFNLTMIGFQDHGNHGHFLNHVSGECNLNNGVDSVLVEKSQGFYDLHKAIRLSDLPMFMSGGAEEAR